MDYLSFMEAVCFIHSANISYFSNDFLSFYNLGALGWVVWSSTGFLEEVTFILGM